MIALDGTLNVTNIMLEPERNKEIDTVDERMLNCIVVTFHSFPLTSHLHLPVCLSDFGGKNTIEIYVYTEKKNC